MKEIYDSFTHEWVIISDKEAKEIKRLWSYWNQRYTKIRNPIKEVNL